MTATIDMTQARTIGDHFAGLLKDDLTKAQFAEILRRNKVQMNGGICHSHDFCDANVLMEIAFRAIVGREPDVGSDADAALWSAAWRHAKKTHLGGGA